MDLPVAGRRGDDAGNADEAVVFPALAAAAAFFALFGEFAAFGGEGLRFGDDGCARFWGGGGRGGGGGDGGGGVVVDGNLEGVDVEVLEGVEGPGFDVDGGLLVGGWDGAVDCHGGEFRYGRLQVRFFGCLDAIEVIGMMVLLLMGSREW